MSNQNYIIDNPDFSFGNLFTTSHSIDYNYTTGINLDGNYSTGGYTFSTINTMDNRVAITAENNSGIIDCKGENADITLNGKSVRKTLEAIEDRLAILQPNEKLESEWEELKELGRQYRELEAEIKEKMRVWDILKRSDDGKR